MDPGWYLRKQLVDIYLNIHQEGESLVKILEYWRYMYTKADSEYIYGHITLYNMYADRVYHELQFGAWKAAVRGMDKMKKEIYALRKTIGQIICKKSIEYYYPLLYFTPRTGRIPNLMDVLPTPRKVSMPPLRGKH